MVTAASSCEAVTFSTEKEGNEACAACDAAGKILPVSTIADDSAAIIFNVNFMNCLLC